MPNYLSCPTCGNKLLRKNRTKLFFVGFAVLLAIVGCFFLSPIFWIATSVLVLIAGYLIVWSTLGKGLWCRQCKKFPIF
jgi:hypothetical protein